MKHVLEPHAADERDQVFCSFLALLMQKELFLRMAKAGIEAEWADILRDLDALTEVEIENGARRFLVRSRAKGSYQRRLFRTHWPIFVFRLR